MVDKDSTDKQELSAERTEFAEDRTILANERTFASWMRTGYAAIGMGLGFQALFNTLQPDWLPRLIASVFLASAVVIFVGAERRACSVYSRLDEHEVETAGTRTVKFLAWVSIIAAIALIIIIWRTRLGAII